MMRPDWPDFRMTVAQGQMGGMVKIPPEAVFTHAKVALFRKRTLPE